MQEEPPTGEEVWRKCINHNCFSSCTKTGACSHQGGDVGCPVTANALVKESMGCSLSSVMASHWVPFHRTCVCVGGRGSGRTPLPGKVTSRGMLYQAGLQELT